MGRFILSILLVLVAASGSRTVTAQKQGPLTPCQVGRNAAGIGFWTWPSGVHVKVFLRRADFGDDEVSYVIAPLQTWNDVSEATGSRVKFEYVGNTAEEVTCENCMTIMRGPVFEKRKRHVTETQAYSVHRDQIITYAAIVIDPSLTNLKALSNAVGHELGHNLGLLDCFSCKRNSTLMGQFRGLNVPNDLEAPTSCDVAQVRQAYAELKLHVRPSPEIARADEGEEPVDDDTPIVVPKPKP